MNLEKYSDEVFAYLLDETLLRYLYYKPLSRLDDPLSPTKNDILTMSDENKKWDIIDSLIINAPKVSDMEREPSAKVFYYPGAGSRIRSTHLFSNQEFIFDIFTHSEFQKDNRNAKICDRIHLLVEDKFVTGLGKMLVQKRHPIAAPKDYFGFRLIYSFVSENQ